MADNCDSGKCPPSEDPLDAKTFTPPVRDSQGSSPTPSIVIEFCNRCRWLHRATWVQTELFLTFPDTQAEEASDGKEPGGKYATAGKGIKAITLIPCNAPDTGGRFRVWLYIGERSSTAQQQQQQRDNGNSKSREGVYEDGKVVLLWDRKIKGGFPELKDLKQRIRDEIAPAHKLGHSDKKEPQKTE